MSELPNKKDENDFSRKVGLKAARKLMAQSDTPEVIWSGLSVMGLIGWSVVVPTLLGAALGLWLDERHPMSHSWTLTLLMMGLSLGCWNAWRWMRLENQSEERDNE